MDVYYLRLPLVALGDDAPPAADAHVEVRTASPERGLGCAAIAVGPAHAHLIGSYGVRHPLRPGTLVPLVLGLKPSAESGASGASGSRGLNLLNPLVDGEAVEVIPAFNGYDKLWTAEYNAQVALRRVPGPPLLIPQPLDRASATFNVEPAVGMHSLDARVACLERLEAAGAMVRVERWRPDRVLMATRMPTPEAMAPLMKGVVGDPHQPQPLPPPSAI